jgi:hypothetical protein
MQNARLIVTAAPEARRKNFEIRCYGDHIQLCFYSGSRENVMVVQVVEGDVSVTITKETSIEWIKGLFRYHWEEYKNVMLYLAETGTGHVRQIIQ